MIDPKAPVSIGMIHGRFQPFHNGHLLYMQEAMKFVDGLLIVGIKNPTASQNIVEASDDHRHLSSANPFSYLQRSLMISRSVHVDLRHAGPLEIAIVPFDVNRIETWGWIPPTAVQFVNLLDPWDHVKRGMFSSRRLDVVETGIPRVTSGEEIRLRRLKGKQYRHLVPKGTASLLQQIDERAESI